jgi:creatinine amidohydrolase
MPSTRNLAELRAPDIVERLTPSSVVIQTIAATEQHGPHLPCATDCIVAESTTDAVLAECGEELDLWALPPLRYGKSNEHAWSPGTVWLSHETLMSVLHDVARCVAQLPTGKLVFVNGHGGNTALLNVALRELRLTHGLQTFLAHPSLPADHGGQPPASELGMGIHSGLDETSVLLHLRPDLVDMSRAERNIPEHLAANRHVRFGGSVSFGWLSDDFGPSGVIGDPTAASAERGEERFGRMVRNLGEALAEVRDFRHRT